ALPTRIPARSTSQRAADIVPPCATSTKTATSATAIPNAETWLPRRAVAGEFIKCKPRTKHTAPPSDANRTAVSTPSVTARPLLDRPRQGAAAEHAQHAVRHEVSADDVRGPKCSRDEQQDVAERTGDEGGQEHDPDENDTMDRVGARHERRVQGRRYLADHLEADEQGEHEDRQVADESGAHEPDPVFESATRRAGSDSSGPSTGRLGGRCSRARTAGC